MRRAGSTPGSRRPSRRAGRRRPPRASCSTSATGRTPTRAPRSTRCAQTFGNKIAPLHLAIGAAETFSGYIDLVHRKAWKLEGGKEVEIPVPAELADEVARRRDQLLEAAAEADDDVLEKYLGEEEISDAELDACLHKGVRESILAPVLVASAAKGIGLTALLDAIVRYLPSPEEERPFAATDKAGKDVEVPASGSQLLARVFKTTADPVRRSPDLLPRAARGR